MDANFKFPFHQVVWWEDGAKKLGQCFSGLALPFNIKKIEYAAYLNPDITMAMALDYVRFLRTWLEPESWSHRESTYENKAVIMFDLDSSKMDRVKVMMMLCAFRYVAEKPCVVEAMQEFKSNPDDEQFSAFQDLHQNNLVLNRSYRNDNHVLFHAGSYYCRTITKQTIASFKDRLTKPQPNVHHYFG